MVAAVALMPRRSVPPPEAATEWPQQRALPAVMATDQHGTTISTAELTDRFTLLFFGFTNCPDICPLSMAVLAEANRRLEESRRTPPRVVLVSVDPQRDTPEVLGDYLERFDSRFIGLTASEPALAPLLEALGVTVMKQPLGERHYTVTHNPQVFVIAPNGNVIATLSRAESADAVVRDYQRIRARFLSGASPSATPR
jgi:protein SCO1/2